MKNLPLMDSIALSCVVYDEETFLPAFLDQLSKAQFSVIIMAPNLTHFGLDRTGDTIKSLTDKGIPVCIFVRPPDKYYDPPSTWDEATRKKMKYFNDRVRELREAGAHVNFFDKEHEKVAVIDGRYVWDGSLNILSFNPDKTSERMTCIDSFFMAMCAIGKHELLYCPDCHKQRMELPGLRYALLSSENLGAQIAAKRKARGLNQSQLSELSGVSRSVIATFEAGTSNANLLETVLAVMDALDEEVITVPRDSLPLIEHLLWSIKPGRLVSERQLTRQKFVRKTGWQRRQGKAIQLGASNVESVNEQTDSNADGFTAPNQTQNFDVPK